MQAKDRAKQLKAQIRTIQTAAEFNATALQVFDFQRHHNPVYGYWLSLINKSKVSPTSWQEIPCAPISIFKTHEVVTGSNVPQRIFKSSGTTGAATAHHAVVDPDWYAEMSVRNFEFHFGPLSEYGVLALLPHYLERGDSSLVAMVQDFIARCGFSDHSGFFLYNVSDLLAAAAVLKQKNAKTLLIGVSYALLDLAEQQPEIFDNALIMETGGMKGRRQELTRPVLHDILKAGFGTAAIASEYGMTELLSQAYAPENGLFLPNSTFKVYATETSDPFTMAPMGRSGALNLIDLANVDACSFLASDDLGRVFADGTFEVLGRIDNSDRRGCNLMLNF